MESESSVVGWIVDGYLHAEVTRDKVEIRRYHGDHVTIDQYVREDTSRIKELEAEIARLEERCNLT